MLRFVLLFLIILNFYRPCCFAGDLDIDEINSILNRAKQDGENMSIPVNKFMDQGMRAARESAALYHSREFQEKVDDHKCRLQKGILKGYASGWQPEKEEGTVLDHELVYVFLSSSIPTEIIRDWINLMSDIKTSKVVFVLKGVPGGINNPDSRWFERIYRKNDDCSPQKGDCEYNNYKIEVKPEVFDKYQISAVPTVVVETKQSSYSIAGDAGLDYLIEQLNKKIKSDGLTALVKEMRKRG